MMEVVSCTRLDENGPHFGAGIADKVNIELHNAAKLFNH